MTPSVRYSSNLFYRSSLVRILSISKIADLEGVSALLGWRATTKPLLHRLLPPLYRLLEKARLDMPRRYFIRAS